jgi:hypothetical protein
MEGKTPKFVNMSSVCGGLLHKVVNFAGKKEEEQNKITTKRA